MIAALRSTLTEMAGSKKVVASVTGATSSAVAWLLMATLGPRLGLTQEQAIGAANYFAGGVVAVAVTYLGAQGAADVGKEAAKVKGD